MKRNASLEFSRRQAMKLGASAMAFAAVSKSASAAASVQFSDTDLAYMPANTQIELFKTGKLSPVEVLEAQIAQSERTQPDVNCFAFVHFDEAMQAARASENRYANGTARPLEGITVAIKDEQAIAGKIVTNGSLLRANDVQDTDHPIVKRIKDAGAVIHAQTTTPEFSMAWVTWSEIHGVTRNPWNLYYSVGGSSGGAGASLASGVTTLATGSDIGGSIRLPSSVNGVFGFFPPFGRVPGAPGSTLIPFASDGPMTRTFDEMVMLQNIITGPDPYTMESLIPDLDYPTSYASIEGMRIGYSMDYGYRVVDRDVIRNTETAIAILRDLGAVVEEVDLQFDKDTVKAAWIGAVLGGSAGGDLLAIAERGTDQMTPYAANIVGLAAEVGPQDVSTGDKLTHQMNRILQDAVYQQGYQALLAPTWSSINERADYDKTIHVPVIEGQEVDTLIGPIGTPEFNVLNRYPIISVPTGRARNNIPTGMQIIANGYDDLTSFRIAAAFSKVAPPLFSGDAFPDYRNEAVE